MALAEKPATGVALCVVLLAGTAAAAWHTVPYARGSGGFDSHSNAAWASHLECSVDGATGTVTLRGTAGCYPKVAGCFRAGAHFATLPEVCRPLTTQTLAMDEVASVSSSLLGAPTANRDRNLFPDILGCRPTRVHTDGRLVCVNPARKNQHNGEPWLTLYHGVAFQTAAAQPTCAAESEYLRGASAMVRGTCETCTNARCGAAEYRAGVCAGAINEFVCKPQAACGDGWYLRGATPTALGTCAPCSNAACAPGTYRGGSCAGSTDGYTCSACSNVDCASTGRYRTGTCAAGNDGYECNYQPSCKSEHFLEGATNTRRGTCTPCANTSCPAGQYRAGDCSVFTTDGFFCAPHRTCGTDEYLAGEGAFEPGQCAPCRHASCPDGHARNGTCGARTKGYTCTPVQPTCPAGEYLRGANATAVGVCTPCSNAECAAGMARSGACEGANDGFVCAVPATLAPHNGTGASAAIRALTEARQALADAGCQRNQTRAFANDTAVACTTLRLEFDTASVLYVAAVDSASASAMAMTGAVALEYDFDLPALQQRFADAGCTEGAPAQTRGAGDAVCGTLQFDIDTAGAIQRLRSEESATAAAAVTEAGSEGRGTPCVGGGAYTGAWLLCATGGECYKAKMQCDGGKPDCADGSDEDPAVCNTVLAPATGAANGTAASRAGEGVASDGGLAAGTLIAIVGIALLVVAGVVTACCCRRCREGEGSRAALVRMNGEAGGDDQVQGLSMSFGNAAFRAPQPYNEDGELYETNEAPQASCESTPDKGAVANPSYHAMGAVSQSTGGGSCLDVAATPLGQSAGGSSAMGIATPSYDAIDDEKSAGDVMDMSVPNYDAIDDTPAVGEPGQHDYDLEDPMGARGPRGVAHGACDHDSPGQGAFGNTEGPPQRVYNLEDPTKAGMARTYDLEDPTWAGHGAQEYDLGHTEARGNARVGHSSHYGNMADGHSAAAAPQHTSYDHDDNSMSEEEI